jgi:hypothetical protein
MDMYDVLPELQEMTAKSINAVAPNELRRELGVASATAVVAGECIAVGIFLTPAGMAKALGSPQWLLLVWLLVGAMTMARFALENLRAASRARAEATSICRKPSAVG